MYDLNIIKRINAASMALEIPGLRASGRWVVAVYNGLHYAEHCDFGTELEAQQEIETRERANSYDRLQLLAPTEPAASDLDTTSTSPDHLLRLDADVSTPSVDGADPAEDPAVVTGETAAA